MCYQAPSGRDRRDFLRNGLLASAAWFVPFETSSRRPSSAATAGSPPEPGSKPFPGVRIIDVHCHPRWLGHDSRKAVENMDRLGIERAWLLSWEAPENEVSPDYYERLNPAALRIRFEDVVAWCEQFPERFIPGTTYDPRDRYAPEKLKAATEIFGVRVFGEFKRRMRYDDPDCLRLFHFCGELGLPVLFHLDVTFPRNAVPTQWQWWYGGDLEAVARALEQCPKTSFIGHAPGFWRELSGDADDEPSAYPVGKPVRPGGRLLRLLDQFPNLYCDLSAGSGFVALTRDPAFARSFLIRYQDRILFGRDEFSDRHLQALKALQLPDAVLRKILAENALKLVPI
jgi:predicted TIM-barrel fold metal-dependent hydrolase